MAWCGFFTCDGPPDTEARAADATDYEKRWLQAERDAGDAERALATAVGLLRGWADAMTEREEAALLDPTIAFLATQGDR